MRKDYKSINEVNLVEKKSYLLKICKNDEIRDQLYNCMNTKAFYHLLTKYNDLFYNQALKVLYSSSNYDDLEYHLVMMNSLFQQASFIDIKKQLLLKIFKKAITINEYCIIRQLIDFKSIAFSTLIKALNEKYEVDDEECARICLLEDQYHLACTYLKKLNDCKDQYLLDLLSSFSLYEYASLMKHYAKKSGHYLLVPTH